MLNIENIDKYCFIWSILAYLHPCNNSHPKKVKNCSQYFDELNIEGFVFTNGFKCSDLHKFKKINTLSKILYELNVYHDGKIWK